jgi:hypothetical protein
MIYSLNYSVSEYYKVSLVEILEEEKFYSSLLGGRRWAVFRKGSWRWWYLI